MFRIIELLHAGKNLVLIGLLAAFLSACGGSGNDNGDDNSGGQPPGAIDDDNDNDDDDGSGDDGSDGDGSDDDDDADDGERAFKTFQAAAFVIGQADFAGSEPHQGGSVPDANSLFMPLGPAGYSVEHNVLFIADSENARVLGFLGIPDTNNANADFVLGQPDFTSSEREISASSMFSPEAVTTTGGRLMVTDTDLNRVTVYDGIPTSGGANPVLVVGQESLDTYVGECDQNTLLHPHAHFLAPDGKLIVADAGNNRVLIWNEMPAEDATPADFVLGQSGFNNCSFLEDDNFKHPAALWSDGERLIVADSEKHRILVWNTFPTESFQAPDVILGQSVMSNIMPNDDDQDDETDAGGTASARTLSYPRSIDVMDGKLYVADMDNHRVLIWNEIPAASFTPADIVIGQENFSNNIANAGEAQPNERGFRRPVGVKVIGEQLLVTEWENSRVLTFEAQ